MSLDEEWALAAQMEAEIRRARGQVADDDDDENNAAAAEGRWLAWEYVRRRLDAKALPWAAYEAQRHHVFELAAAAVHECSRETCTQLQAPARTRFADPLTGRSFAASGDVYVCCVTGATHVCADGVCALEQESAHDRGTTLCPVSGRYKTSLLSQQESFREREARLADPRPSRSTKRPSSTRTAEPKRPRGPETARAQQQREVERVCRELVCSGVVWRAMSARVPVLTVELEASTRRAIERRVVTSPAALMAHVVAFCAHRHVDAALRLHARGEPPPMPAERVAYLTRCVGELFALVRSAGGKDVTLRKMCVPLLYVMMRGLVGMIETCRRTGRILNRRVMRDAGSPPAAPDAPAGTVLRHYTFVPAHAWLARYLPHDEHALPAIPGWEVELGNQMKRMRSVEQAFLQAMRGNGEVAATFCLAAHVEPLQTL